MQPTYSMSLNHEYAFMEYCSQRSIEAFEQAIEKNHSFSSFQLITLLTFDIIAIPFDLISRIHEIALYLFHFLMNQAKSESLLEMKNLRDMTGFLFLQILIPMTCTAIRISATLLGLLNSAWALQGWKIAESGESLYYSLWSQEIESLNLDCEEAGKEVDEEINPKNAIFYLGKKETAGYLEDTIEDDEIEESIFLTFGDLLQKIAKKDMTCFSKLVYYEEPTADLSKKHPPYHFSPSIKHILSRLQPETAEPLSFEEGSEDLEDSLSTEGSSSESDSVNSDISHFIKQITTILSIEQTEKLFYHIYLNLQSAFLSGNLKEIQVEIEEDIKTLKDLFSKQFRFGRAHFPLVMHNIAFYHQD